MIGQNFLSDSFKADNYILSYKFYTTFIVIAQLHLYWIPIIVPVYIFDVFIRTNNIRKNRARRSTYIDFYSNRKLYHVY